MNWGLRIGSNSQSQNLLNFIKLEKYFKNKFNDLTLEQISNNLDDIKNELTYKFYK